MARLIYRVVQKSKSPLTGFHNLHRFNVGSSFEIPRYRHALGSEFATKRLLKIHHTLNLVATLPS